MYTLSTAYKILGEKLALSPGLPRPNPTTPYWAIPPSSIAKHNSGCDKDLDGAFPDSHGCRSSLPDYADVVIVGSGITGTAFARTLLDWHRGNDPDTPLKVVMLEARDACSGATARFASPLHRLQLLYLYLCTGTEVTSRHRSIMITLFLKRNMARLWHNRS